MTIGDVKRAFLDKKDMPCPMTEALVQAWVLRLLQITVF